MGRQRASGSSETRSEARFPDHGGRSEGRKGRAAVRDPLRSEESASPPPPRDPRPRVLDESRLRPRDRRGEGLRRAGTDGDRRRPAEPPLGEPPPGARGGAPPPGRAGGGAPDALASPGARAREVPPPRGAPLQEGAGRAGPG